jgi:hypothetical protein
MNAKGFGRGEELDHKAGELPRHVRILALHPQEILQPTFKGLG